MDLIYKNEIIITIGLMCIFAGTAALSSAIFKKIILSHYFKAHWDDKYPPLKYRIIGYLFNIKRGNWLNMLRVDLTEKEEKELKDPYAPLRGIVWIAIGTILEIMGLFL
jgi:hypothetical protein